MLNVDKKVSNDDLYKFYIKITFIRLDARRKTTK